MTRTVAHTRTHPHRSQPSQPFRQLQVAAGNLQYPHFRPLVPLVEELQARHGWGEDDFTLLFQDSLYNVIYGWCLGTGFYTNSTHFAAMTKVSAHG
jgi:hypothetical protein